MEKLIFSLVISFLAISQVSALHCWRCSSDTLNGQFCADPFNANLLTEAQKQWYYVECPLPTNSTNSFIPDNARPVCKKIIQQVKEKKVFARACSWEVSTAAPDACRYAITPPDVQTMFCETCRTDGCNALKDLNDPERTPSTTENPNGAVSGFIFNPVTLIVVGVAAFLQGF